MKEELKYKTIKKLVEENGNKNRAAVTLNCSRRTINRLILRYKEMGKQGFVHGNRDRAPSTTFSLDVRNRIISLYVNEYSNANIQHFAEIVHEDLDINISAHTILNWLKEENILSPKARKKTKKMMKKKLKQEIEETKSKKLQNEYKEQIHRLDESEAHPRRPRMKYMGEMIQMDASSFEWIPNEIWHLHVAIDDATDTLVGAYFDLQETLNGYYNVYYQILNDYGIPYLFYTDKRTVFEYRRKNRPFDDEDTFTQFSYACHQLGVEIKTTSVPQAKGRVERVNQTLQSRLPVELKRHNVKTIEEANEFLKSYLAKFNDQFALHLNGTKSVFAAQPSEKQINTTLAILSERKIDCGHSIRFKNQYYIPCDANGIKQYFLHGTECLVIQSFDKQLYVNIDEQLYSMERIEEHSTHSENFDFGTKTEKEKKKYIPPLDHPWRMDMFKFFKSNHTTTESNI